MNNGVNYTYKLISVIHHHGKTLQSGHYFVERENVDVSEKNSKIEWFLISDEKVKRT